MPLLPLLTVVFITLGVSPSVSWLTSAVEVAYHNEHGTPHVVHDLMGVTTHDPRMVVSSLSFFLDTQ